jgi:hypothetical protein
LVVVILLLKDKTALSGWRLGYGLNARGIGVRFPAEIRYFYFPHAVKAVLGANPASYTTGTGGEAAGT